VVKKLLLFVAIVYTIALLIASLINLNNVPSLGSSFDDKIYHIIAYLGLAFLWVNYFKPIEKRQKAIFILVAVMSFGALIEILQRLLNPNRTFDTNDIIANCIGAILGTLIAYRLDVLKLK